MLNKADWIFSTDLSLSVEITSTSPASYSFMLPFTSNASAISAPLFCVPPLKNPLPVLSILATLEPFALKTAGYHYLYHNGCNQCRTV
jgi:hypothetical protein